MTAISRAAIEAWQRVRAIQKRASCAELGAADATALRELLRELGRLLDFDPRLIEVHRIPADGGIWRWANAPEHYARFARAKEIAAALDAAVTAAQLAELA
jgi:hypothetical protein